MITYGKYQIDDSRAKGNQGKTRCPMCEELGKKHFKDDCLSINRDKQVFNCHKCGFSGYFGEIITNVETSYKLPDIGNLTELKDTHLQSFSKRGITQKAIIRNGIKTAKGEWIAFPYFEGAQIVNLKYRHAKEKKFMQAKEAKPTMYKYNDIVGQENIIICEGEYDALSWEEAGYLFATSVNQGAPNAKDKNIEKKIECIYNCFDIFENASTIYLSVDSDENGQRLQKELIKIFTAEKVKLIDHGTRKDANEILCKDGKGKLKELFDGAKDVKVEGIFSANDVKDQLIYNYRNGQPRGTTTYFDNIDECWTHRPGEVTIWTGYNNEGKSLLLKQLLLLKSKNENWKHALFSPEEVPIDEFFTDVIESYIGKSADTYNRKYQNYMTEIEFNEGLEFVNKHFRLVYPENDFTLDELLNKFSYLVRKHNYKTVTLDPWNQIHHKMEPGEREDLYISRIMTKLKRFAVDHWVGVHLVAHQTTPLFSNGQNYPEPNIYKIKGGGTFGDKADNIIAVWREHRNTDRKNTEVKFISQKIKKQKLTGIPGTAILEFNYLGNRYNFDGESPLQNKINGNDIDIEPNFNNLKEIGEMPF